MGFPNHTERAADCWKAMMAATPQPVRCEELVRKLEAAAFNPTGDDRMGKFVPLDEAIEITRDHFAQDTNAGSKAEQVDEAWLLGELQSERAFRCPGTHRELFDEGILAAYNKLRPYLRTAKEGSRHE